MTRRTSAVAIVAGLAAATFALLGTGVALGAPDGPTAVDDHYSVGHATVLTVPASTGVFANDSGIFTGEFAALQGDTLHGHVALAADGSFTYTPTTGVGFAGDDTFTYCIYDPGQTRCVSRTAQATITVTGPTANDDTYLVDHDTPLAVPAPGVLGNDTGLVSGDVTLVQAQPQHGSLNLLTDGTFSYTPDPGTSGPDSFTYCISFVKCLSTATVSLFIARADPPVAVPDFYTTKPGDTLVTTPASGVLANDTSVAPADSWRSLSSPAHGTVTGLGTGRGEFTYTPDAGFTGIDALTYCVSPGLNTGRCLSNSATVTIDIAIPPVAVDDSYSTTTGQALTVPPSGVLANDTGVTAAQAATVVAGPTHGTLASDMINANGGFVYTPAAGFHGADSFTYCIAASGTTTCASNVATVGIEVMPAAPSSSTAPSSPSSTAPSSPASTAPSSPSSPTPSATPTHGSNAPSDSTSSPPASPGSTSSQPGLASTGFELMTYLEIAGLLIVIGFALGHVGHTRRGHIARHR